MIRCNWNWRTDRREIQFLKAGKYAECVSAGAPVYLSAMLEYLAAEVSHWFFFFFFRFNFVGVFGCREYVGNWVWLILCFVIIALLVYGFGHWIFGSMQLETLSSIRFWVSLFFWLLRKYWTEIVKILNWVEIVFGL